MFGWSKTPDNSAKKNKTGSLDLGSLGIEGLDDLDIPLNDDFDEVDLNDPELLGELSALGLNTQTNKSKSKLKSQQQQQLKSKSNLISSTSGFLGDIDIDKLSALGNEEDVDQEIEVTEEDMKDPNLLKELQGLGGHQNDEEKNNNIKRAIKGKIVLQETQTKVTTTTTNNNNKDDNPSNVLVNQESSELQIVEEQSIEVKLQSNDVNVLAKYIQEEKLNAIMKKREGDKAGAMESMKVYKQLEAKRTKLLSQSNQVSETEIKSKDNNKVVSSTVSTNITEQQQQQQQQVLSSQQRQVLSSQQQQQVLSSQQVLSQQKPEISSQNQEIIDILNKRFKQYKEATVTIKTSDIQRAREFLNTATAIHKTIKSLENGDELPEGFEIPNEPNISQRETAPISPSTTLQKAPENVTPVSTPKKKVLTVLDNAANTGVIDDDEQPFTMISKKDQYARLISQLESQVALCTTISAYYMKIGNKTQAATFYRYKKSFAADLTSLTSYLMHDKNVPAFHFQDITYSVENAFLDLSANDMEVCIIRAYNLGSKEVNGKDVDAYVSWDIGWPTEGNPGAGNGKGDTPTASRGMDPEFNYKKIISIERTKAFQRYVGSKKATFEVFHYKGFLRKPISLGKVSVKLDPFIDKAEIHHVLDLVDQLRRPTGGKLEIRLRMRLPLSKADVISKTEKWLIIDEFNSNNSTFANLPTTNQTSTSVPATPVKNNLQTDSLVSTPMTPPPPSTPTPPQPQTPTRTPLPPSTPTTPVSRQRSASHKKVVATTQSRETVSTVSTSTEQNELEKAGEQLDSVDTLVSNLVIQHEVDTVNAQIAALEAQRKSIPDDLMDRKTALDIKQNLLVIQVQTGQLTMDKYLDQVRESIINFKKLALVFKKAGKMEEAKKALGRSKIMEGEVKEVEEAMASGAMG